MRKDDLIQLLIGRADTSTRQEAIDSFASSCGKKPELKDCSLSGANLSELCFTSLDMTRVDMTSCRVVGTQFAALTECCLADAQLEACHVISSRGCELTNARLIRLSILHQFHRNACSGATFDDVAFGVTRSTGQDAMVAQSDFSGATVVGSCLSGLHIDKCKFSSAQFVDSTLARSCLSDCDLQRAGVTRCSLINTAFDRCNMEESRIRLCVAREQDIVWLRNRSIVTDASEWSDDETLLRTAARAVLLAGECRLRWVMKRRRANVESGAVLWATTGQHHEGAVVWSRDREVLRMYPFESEHECVAAISNWLSDSAMWSWLPGSLECDGLNDVLDDAMRCVERILRR